jgi:GNAT superfamily N-acetyltransferase
MALALQEALQTRPVGQSDLPALVAIDAEHSGRRRRDYFERRLATAQRDPERAVQVAIEQSGQLVGFMLGRVLEGEFGRSESEIRVEAFGVHGSAEGRGVGSALEAAFEQEATRRGVVAIRTAALWRQHELLRFLDRCGFALAPAQVLERAAADDLAPLERDAIEPQLLRESDIDGIARIDARHTGRDRRGYLCRTLREALGDSAVRVSLVARVDGNVAGFVMARMDYGDFGRVEPSAVIDTVGVDPLRAREGIGRALLSQLLLNLHGLGVERVETVVPAGELALTGFFYASGFRPSDRLAFVKRLGPPREKGSGPFFGEPGYRQAEKGS